MTNREKLIDNSLEAVRPDIAEEWDYERNSPLTPADVSYGSGKKAWWHCVNGHSYQSTIGSRTAKKSSSCPYCSIPAKKVLKGFNDFKTKYPDLAEEWHPTKNLPLTPDEVLSGSNKKVWWICSKGHEYEQSIALKAEGMKCPYCSNQKLLTGYNDFATKHPELLEEWDYEKNDILPTEIAPHSHKKIWWKCPFGHSYQAWISNRSRGHSGCPICDKENHTSFAEQALLFYISKYFQDVRSSDKSAIGAELDIFIPSLKTAIEYDGKHWHKNSHQNDFNKNELCKANGITMIRIREVGLPLFDNCTCILRETLRSENSLNACILQVLSELSIMSANVDVDRDSSAIYSNYIKSRKQKSLQSISPQLAAEWHPVNNGNLEPSMVSPNSNKKVWWLGTCGHEWQMTIQDRFDQNCNCPICAGKQILTGFNDLKTQYPDLCEEWNYELNEMLNVRPETVAAHSDKKVWWTCKQCGNVWRAKIDSRTRMRAGCPSCANKYIASTKFKPVQCLETGVVYQSIKEAAEETGIHPTSISEVCRGKNKTAGKLHWKYYNRTLL